MSTRCSRLGLVDVLQFVYGLSRPSARAFEILLEHGPLTAVELAERLGYRHNAVYSVVRDLEYLGLARRVPGKRRGRSVGRPPSLIEVAPGAVEKIAGDLEECARELAGRIRRRLQVLAVVPGERG